MARKLQPLMKKIARVPEIGKKKNMTEFAKGLALIGLPLVPAAILYYLGLTEIAHYVALGSVLAAMIAIMARPIGMSALLIPVVYLAAAVTAEWTDGVVALIVALVAFVGAASSLGYHRGLMGLLAAALIGSFEPAASGAALVRAGGLAAGSVYGALLGWTLFRGVSLDTRAVKVQTALGYAVVTALLVVVAWFTARAMGVQHGWWLPLAIAAAGEPSLDRPPLHAVGRLAVAFLGILLLASVASLVSEPASRVALLLALLAVLALFGPGHAGIRSVLLVPLMLLLVSHDGFDGPGIEYLQTMSLACLFVFACALLGRWIMWTLRPDPGRAAATLS